MERTRGAWRCGFRPRRSSPSSRGILREALTILEARGYISRTPDEREAAER